MTTVSPNSENTRRDRILSFIDRVEPYFTNGVFDAAISTVVANALGAAFGAAVGYVSNGTPGRGAVVGVGISSALLAAVAAGEALADKFAEEYGAEYIGDEGTLSYRLRKRWSAVAFSVITGGAAAVGYYWPANDKPSEPTTKKVADVTIQQQGNVRTLDAG